jgi:SAM-dependent methyltransferase
MRQRSRSFDAWAREYDRYRPTYPQALFDYVAERLELPAQAFVADVGSGTGKAARQMARRGWRVTAIEPGEGMLDVLRSRAAEEGLAIDARLGSAEAAGLPDASVDLVTVGQAFHWFDRTRAVPEMARVVRPAGGAAIFWNSRADDRSQFLADYTELTANYLPEHHIDRRTHEPSSALDLAKGGFFAVEGRVELPWVRTMTADEFVGMNFTGSQFQLFMDTADQARLATEIRELIAAHFGDGDVVVPYDVDLYVGSRTSARGG